MKDYSKHEIVHVCEHCKGKGVKVVEWRPLRWKVLRSLYFTNASGPRTERELSKLANSWGSVHRPLADLVEDGFARKCGTRPEMWSLTNQGMQFILAERRARNGQSAG